MSYIQNVYPIQSRDAIARDVFDYVVACPDIASQSHAGQFVHIRVAGHTLRRPISICEVNREKGTLRLVFEVRGSGTEAMSMLSVGDLMDVMGPLGNGFTLLSPDSRAIVVAAVSVPRPCWKLPSITRKTVPRSWASGMRPM